MIFLLWLYLKGVVVDYAYIVEWSISWSADSLPFILNNLQLKKAFLNSLWPTPGQTLAASSKFCCRISQKPFQLLIDIISSTRHFFLTQSHLCLLMLVFKMVKIDLEKSCTSLTIGHSNEEPCLVDIFLKVLLLLWCLSIWVCGSFVKHFVLYRKPLKELIMKLPSFLTLWGKDGGEYLGMLQFRGHMIFAMCFDH